MKSLLYIDLGLIDYKEAWDLQKKIFDLRVNNKIVDVLLLLEHPHTYTLGKTAKREHLLENNISLLQKNISVYDIDRGGDITYHGPGQIVGYPIIDLNNWNKDAHKYLRSLEEVIIRCLYDYSIPASRDPKYTGVWIDNRKIAAIGVKLSRWVTMHGFAFNINTDLSLFSGIVPCGIFDKAVTSLQKETGSSFDIEEIKNKLVKNFKTLFYYDEIHKIDIDTLFEESSHIENLLS